MLKDETEPTARRVGPIPCFDVSDNPVDPTGVTVEKIYPGAIPIPASALVNIGSGWGYYQADATDAAEEPWIAITASGTCIETVFREEVKETLSGIAADETDVKKRTIGPLPIYDADDVALTSIAGVTCEVSLNGAAWGAPAGAFNFVSDGVAEYVADTAELTAIDRGWIAVRLTGTCEEYVMRADVGVFGSAGGGGGATIGNLSPAEGSVISRNTPITLQVTATNRPPSSVVISAIMGGSTVEELVFGGTNFAGPYTGGSNSRVNIMNGYEFTILRLGGWRGTSITLRIVAVASSGEVARKTLTLPDARYTWQLVDRAGNVTPFVGGR